MSVVYRLPVLDPGYTGFAHTPSGFAYPAAPAYRPVGNRAPHFASQIDAARALHDRLYPQVVTLHPPKDTPGDEAA